MTEELYVSVKKYVFTSESVAEGHPDKVSDQISDAVVDALFSKDPKSRVACETLVKNNLVILAGEISSTAEVNYEDVVRSTIRQIGYIYPEIGFDADSCEVMQFINAQSPDISMGVNEGEGSYKEQGAGDQGLMFGFACSETEELMPLPITLAHQLTKKLAELRHAGDVDFLRPDVKSQVSVLYEGKNPVALDTIVISSQHAESVSLDDLKSYIRETVIPQVVPAELLTASVKYFINPTGRFVVGGPVGDAGLTGRKIIVDTYGGYSRHGGGAFSGKDPSKVDRSAAYMARYIAKNIVAAGLAERCEVQLAYAIGVAEPVSVLIDTFGTGTVDENRLSTVVREVFALTPRGIIESLDLLKPIYQLTAAYGHFGRTPTAAGHFSWEKTDKADVLKSAF